MKLADTQAAAALVARPPATIRSWARKGLLARHGEDHRGRTLYDLDEVQAIDAQHARRGDSTHGT